MGRYSQCVGQTLAFFFKVDRLVRYHLLFSSSINVSRSETRRMIFYSNKLTMFRWSVRFYWFVFAVVLIVFLRLVFFKWNKRKEPDSTTSEPECPTDRGLSLSTWRWLAAGHYIHTRFISIWIDWMSRNNDTGVLSLSVLSASFLSLQSSLLRRFMDGEYLIWILGFYFLIFYLK